MFEAPSDAVLTGGASMSSVLRREQILDATLKLATEQGFAAVTMDKVARESGTTRAQVAEHFGDLGELVASLVDREAQGALAMLTQKLAELPVGTDLAHAQMAIIQAMIDTASTAPASWRMMLNPGPGDPPELHHRTAAARSLVREHVRKILVEKCAGDFADPQLTAHVRQLVDEEMVRLHLSDPALYPLDRILRQVEELAGYRPGASASG
jgi:AcrR family transcriptional regulator